MDAQRVAKLAARNSYGRLVAYLAARSRDLAAAEDALGEAFLAALKTWPDNVPNNPEAWLLVTARRQLIDTARRTQTQTKILHTLNLSGFEAPADLSEEISFPDERLKLLFICAHPAIDVNIRTPLMLQTVLGLNAAQIASSFLVAPTTMGQRLVRAKAKIRDAGIPFRIPGKDELPGRLEAVLEAIYAAYTIGWEDIAGSDPRPRRWTEEALWLARLCVQLIPQEPETRGLLALMLYCESRRQARRTPSGKYVPLLEQDPALWSQTMIDEAEKELTQASASQKLGRFQLEAAIQSVHAQRTVNQKTDWEALAQLYEGLVMLSPTVGALVGHAAAIAETQGPDQGLSQLDPLPANTVENYQPYWALKAHLLRHSGQKSAADQAYSQAIGLTEDPAIREFLLHQSSNASQRPNPAAD